MKITQNVMVRLSAILPLCAAVTACNMPKEITASEHGVNYNVSLEEKGAAYPNDCPIVQYPGSRVVGVSDGPMAPGAPVSKSVGLSTKDSKETIISYYKNQLTANGWQEEADSQDKQARLSMGMLGASKGDQNILIEVKSSSEVGGSMINLTYFK